MRSTSSRKFINSRTLIVICVLLVIPVSGFVAIEIGDNTGPGTRPTNGTTAETSDFPSNRSHNAVTGTIVADNTTSVEAYAYDVNFTRAEQGTPVFWYDVHDPIAVQGEENTYLIGHLGSRLNVWRHPGHSVPVAATRWIPEGYTSEQVEGQHSSTVDSMIYAEGRYISYSDAKIKYAPMLGGNWDKSDAQTFGKDPGAFYDGETYHLFYQEGPTSNHSSPAIGHATSPNGLTNWTRQDPVYTAPSGMGTGDYAIVEENGLYFIFGDYTRNHPRYTVSVWVNDDLSSEFTRVGHIMSPRNVTDEPGELGTQDPTIIYDSERDRYVLFAHVHETTGKRLHAMTGQINVHGVNSTTEP